MGVVIDSSIFIAAERGRFDWIPFHAGLNAEPLYLTAITLAELLHGAARADTVPRKTARLTLVEDIESRFLLLPFARGAVAEYAQIWATLSLHGNLIGTHDMQIAAIARHEGHRVATLKAGEFTRVPELEVLDAAAFRMSSEKW